MATGGALEEVDSRVTCSVCLERYTGRCPKLLPCFHTFCLPCLTQLTASQVTEKGVAGLSSVTCPTCRTVHPLPPGGVTALQTNFYVVDDPPVTSNQSRDVLATAEPSAKHPNDVLDTKVKDKVKVMEAVMSKLSDQEKEIDRQRKAVELDIHAQFDAGVQMLAECRDESLVSVGEAARQLHDKLQAEMFSHNFFLTSLKQSADCNSSAAAHARHNPAALLSDAAFRHFQQQASGAWEPSPALLFQHKRCPASESLLDNMRQFIGTVTPRGNLPAASPQLFLDQELLTSNTRDSELTGKTRDSELTSKTRDSELTSKSHDSELTSKTRDSELISPKQSSASDTELARLKDEVASLKTEYSSLQVEVAALKDSANQSSVMADIQNLQMDVTKNSANLNSVMTDIGSLQKDVGKNSTNLGIVITDVGNLQQTMTRNVASLNDVKSKVGNLITEKCLSSVQKSLSSVQTDVSGNQRTLKQLDCLVTELKTSMGRVTTPIFFNTIQSEEAKLAKGETLILDTVIDNLGGGYDVTTGVFTAPFAGTYFFICSSFADGKRNCVETSQKNTTLVIVAEDNIMGWMRCHGSTSSTAHAVVRLDKGHKVCLESYAENCFVSGGQWTRFSGMLL